MFEDSLVRPKKEKPSSRDVAIGILVTVLVHAVLGFVVVFGRFTVKVLPFAREEVRPIMLVPPLNVAIPKIVGGHGLNEVPGEGRGAAEPARPSPKPEAAGVEPGPAAAEPAQPAGGGTVPPPGSGSAIPSLSSRFRESIAVHGKSGLTIPLAPPGTPPGPPGVGAGAPLPDFSKYSRGAYGGGVGGYGKGGGATGQGGGGGRQRVGMSIPLKGYDLLPWATKVIDRLQLNWALPAVPEVPEAARISMVVVIKKTGELDSIEILEGTSLETLDRAALDAIRASLPFPALPADFPGDLLEINFEFVYND
ncbi:MAG: TonB C-terminal domain-containing protein [Candidatus Aminicenantales bacterium]